MGNTTLFDIKTGESALIDSINITGDIRRRLFDLGFVKKSLVRCVGASPSGDPAAYLIRGAVIALRNDESRKIMVRKVEAD